MNLFHHYNLKKGIVLVVLGWLCFSSLWAISKVIGPQTTIPTMLFFRSVPGFIAILPWMIMKWPKSLTVKNYKVVLIRSIVGTLNLFFIFLAVEKISLVNTTLLNNSAPFFVPIIIWFWLKVPINHKLWPAIIAGFIGIALILHPDKRIFNMGAVYGILSGICLAFSLVTMRLASKKETLYSFMFYFFLIGMVAALPFALSNWKIESGMTLLALIGMGIFSALGQVLLYFGLKLGKAHQLAPFTYSTVVFSGFYEWLIWNQYPTSIAYLGIALILGAGIWIVWITAPRKEVK